MLHTNTRGIIGEAGPPDMISDTNAGLKSLAASRKGILYEVRLSKCIPELCMIYPRALRADRPFLYPEYADRLPEVFKAFISGVCTADFAVSRVYLVGRILLPS